MQKNRLSNRNFGLMFAGVFLSIAAIAWLINGSHQHWAIILGAAFLTVALVWSPLLLPLNRLWEQLGHSLGLVSNSVLLGIFFFFIITPFGLMMRLVSSDPMHRRRDRVASSYFNPVRRQANRDTFADMF